VSGDLTSDHLQPPVPGAALYVREGLNQNWNRDYDPVAGKYLESDPVGIAGGIDTYSYASAEPILLIDPRGFWSWGDPINPTVANSVTGFGDAFLIPILVRAVFNYGTVDQCSTAYKAGEIAGTVWGFIPIGLEEAALLADRTLLNSNQYFRIGMGRWGKDMLPRVSTPYFQAPGTTG
jgi:RHS repeat-associated protein